MLVAQLRGAKFVLSVITNLYVPEEGISFKIATDALMDVVIWLNFKGIDDYLDTLSLEHEKIFDRAKD